MRRLLLPIVLAFAAACGDTSGPDTGHTGLYTLHSVDGDPVPATLFAEGEDYIRVVSGTLTLEADGTFRAVSTLDYRFEGVAATETGSSTGTWSRSGTTVTFTGSEGDVITAEYDGSGQLTLSEEGSTLVYRK